MSAMELKGYFPLQTRLGLSLQSYLNFDIKISPMGFGRQKMTSWAKKLCQFSFIFFIHFLNSDSGVGCLEFARLPGKEKEN